MLLLDILSDIHVHVCTQRGRGKEKRCKQLAGEQSCLYPVIIMTDHHLPVNVSKLYYTISYQYSSKCLFVQVKINEHFIQLDPTDCIILTYNIYSGSNTYSNSSDLILLVLSLEQIPSIKVVNMNAGIQDKEHMMH